MARRGSKKRKKQRERKNVMCAECGERRAVRFAKGGKKVRKAKFHPLCPKCYRAESNRSREGNCVMSRRRPIVEPEKGDHADGALQQ